MIKKSDVVRQYVASGDYKRALQIAKDFRIGISKEHSDAMKQGYEAMLYPDFYKQINVNVNVATDLAIKVITALYGDKNKKED